MKNIKMTARMTKAHLTKSVTSVMTYYNNKNKNNNKKHVLNVYLLFYGNLPNKGPLHVKARISRAYMSIVFEVAYKLLQVAHVRENTVLTQYFRKFLTRCFNSENCSLKSASRASLKTVKKIKIKIKV